MSTWKAVLLTALIGIFAVSFLSLITLIGLGGGDRSGSRVPGPEEPAASPSGSPSPGGTPGTPTGSPTPRPAGFHSEENLAGEV